MLLPLAGLLSTASAWPLLGAGGEPLDRNIDASALFIEAPASLGGVRIQTDPAALSAVAAEALAYLERNHGVDPGVVPGMLGEVDVSLEDVRRTLEFVVRIAQEDSETGASRLTDPLFLQDNFRIIRWHPDTTGAAERGHRLPDGEIRMTRYLVYQLPGSRQRTETHPYALYGVPDDACRTRYTRAEVIGGIYDSNPDGCTAEPLVWLTRRGVFEAMMQGTIEVTLPDGARAMYNVARPNEMPYDPGIRDPNKQRRYWYFAEVDSVRGWGPEPPNKVGLRPMVAVAGDVYNLGLGKLIALRSGESLRLAVLADTGGAFQPNLFQLDYFVGSYPSREAFQEATRHLPSTVEASILVWEPPMPRPPDPVAPTP